MKDRPIEVARVHFICMYMYTVCSGTSSAVYCTSHQGTSTNIETFLSTGIFNQSKQRRKKSKDGGGGGGADGSMTSSAGGGGGGAGSSFSFSADGDDQTDPATIVSTACVVSYGG